MHIHIVGICGTFMAGVAAIAQQAGFRVTGCDANVYPPMSTQLSQMGIELIPGFDAAGLSIGADVYVIGNVVKRGNPLMEAILDRGLRYQSGPQWLAENILVDKWVLAVAGTHGKTTTSAMLAWILQEAGLAPGFLIGGVPQNFGVSARLPGHPTLDPHSISPFFVIEADEYDTAFFDKRSKCIHYRPRTAILNNLEYDHADIFPDLAAIETQFHHFVRTIPRNGCLVVNGREPSLERVLQRGCWTPVELLGSDAAWQMGNVDATTNSFDVLYQGVTLGRLAWSLLGEHNRMNALAAMAAARHVGVPVELALDALSRFQSVKRRMEVRGTVNGITVYDDFAHHPTAIATTLQGLRARVGTQRILAVLEPRSNTMKLGTMKEALPGALALADRVFCSAHQLGWDPRDALRPLGAAAETFDVFDDLVNAIVAEAQCDDHILVMSNGGFNGIHQTVLNRLAAR